MPRLPGNSLVRFEERRGVQREMSKRDRMLEERCRRDHASSTTGNQSLAELPLHSFRCNVDKYVVVAPYGTEPLKGCRVDAVTTRRCSSVAFILLLLLSSSFPSSSFPSYFPLAFDRTIALSFLPSLSPRFPCRGKAIGNSQLLTPSPSTYGPICYNPF